MSDIEHDPIDVFADLGLEDFKKSKEPQPVATRPAPRPEMEVIRATAEQGAFVSRQPTAPKKKMTPKTFSLFPEENEVIEYALKACHAYPDERFAQPSFSDIVRAALHVFSTLPAEEQVSHIKAHRGRGRK